MDVLDLRSRTDLLEIVGPGDAFARLDPAEALTGRARGDAVADCAVLDGPGEVTATRSLSAVANEGWVHWTASRAPAPPAPQPAPRRAETRPMSMGGMT